ncbi:hypothetical protein WJX79_005617 [Trebouxia sp. C0005]
MVTATTQDAGWQISPMLVGATKACLRSQALQKPDWDGEEKHEGDLAETWCTASGGHDTARHPNGLPQAHITALDNRAGGEELLALLRTKQPGRSHGPGTVYLAGTGPGDPGLLTLRAVQLMQTAEVVLYDRLVSPDILRLVHGGARMVYVGKQKGFHTRTQDEIHELLCNFAMEGSSVLRLKGGDPFVFGRGGEEVQYLQQRNIKTHVIPGITAASGICAELGIPLTHRGVATSVRFLTGHSREGDEAQLDESIAACADPHTTLVVYMGLGTLPALTQQLTAAGLSPGTPAVAIERGTTPDQRTVWAPVDHLCDDVEEANLQSPTLVIIGEVVGLAKGWRHADSTGQQQRASWSEFRESWQAEAAQQQQQHPEEANIYV